MRETQIILASASPRRAELFQRLGIPFDIIPATGEEVVDPNLSPSDLVLSLAKAKSLEISQKYPHALVIGADTLVAQKTQIFGKPQSEEDAFAQLSKLQGKVHHVYTGVYLSGVVDHGFVERTAVLFRKLSPGEIQGYLAQGESMDKAGSYGIQGKGALLIEQIQGDYHNVVGLPLCALAQALSRANYQLFQGGPQ